VGWSRLAQPALHSGAEPVQPLRLVEPAVAKEDPDPKALACYGRLVRGAAADGSRTEGTWLRKEALLRVWDHAPWHVSRAVRQWIRAHNRQVKHTGQGVRIVNLGASKAIPLPAEIRTVVLVGPNEPGNAINYRISLMTLRTSQLARFYHGLTRACSDERQRGLAFRAGEHCAQCPG